MDWYGLGRTGTVCTVSIAESAKFFTILIILNVVYNKLAYLKFKLSMNLFSIKIKKNNYNYVNINFP